LYFPYTGGASILDVDDAACGVVAALKQGRSGQRYCLAGENITIEQMCRLIAEPIGRVPVKAVPLWVMTTLSIGAEALGCLGLNVDFSLDIRRQSGVCWWASGRKAREELGFTPRYSAREAIARSVEWLKHKFEIK
jgi:nucleoside-diphosphate-sugar epimerase